ELARGLDDALKAAQPAATRPVASPVTTQPMPVRRAEQRRPTPPPRRPVPPPVRQSSRALPRWIPVAALVIVLLIVAGAIAALSNGGADNSPASTQTASHKPTKPTKAKKKSTATRAPA